MYVRRAGTAVSRVNSKRPLLSRLLLLRPPAGDVIASARELFLEFGASALGRAINSFGHANRVDTTRLSGGNYVFPSILGKRGGERT